MQAVAPFIDPVTKKKIYFIEPGAGGAATMASLFDMSGLEEGMGGGVPGTLYDHGAYGRRMEGEEARMRSQVEAMRTDSTSSGSPSGPSLSRVSSGGSIGGPLKSVAGRGGAAVHAHGEAAWVTRISGGGGGGGGGGLLAAEGSEVWYDAEEGWACGEDGGGGGGDGGDGGWTVARP